MYKLFLQIAILCLLAFWGLFAYWLFWPVTPFIPSASVREILNPDKTVKQGDYIIYKGGGEHFTSEVVVDVHAELVDGFVLQFAPSAYITEKGLRESQPSAKYKVPCFIPPGEYQLKLASIFHINPVRDIVFQIATEPFMIVQSSICAKGN